MVIWIETYPENTGHIVSDQKILAILFYTFIHFKTFKESFPEKKVHIICKIHQPGFVKLCTCWLYLCYVNKTIKHLAVCFNFFFVKSAMVFSKYRLQPVGNLLFNFLFSSSSPNVSLGCRKMTLNLKKQNILSQHVGLALGLLYHYISANLLTQISVINIIVIKDIMTIVENLCQ